MDIKISHNWLLEHLQTDAKPKDIARCISLCGPTFDRTKKTEIDGKVDYIYDIEVTTNRVDAACVRGIAREASAILPEFGYKAKLKNLNNQKIKPKANGQKIDLIIDSKITTRVMAVVLTIDKIVSSPTWMKERLEASGIRSLNAPVDITNYVMTEIGHPTHVFDYDLVSPVMRLRESVKNEEIVSFDNKKYTLPGGDIVIDDGKGKIIDLPGIIGTKNSVVNKDTKRILFFLDTNDPVRIRKTSMTLGIRTIAATLNEKGVDPELAPIALNRGVNLFVKIQNAKVSSKIYDIYPKKESPKAISLNHDFLEKRLGVKIDSNSVEKILKKLEFKVTTRANIYLVTPPTFRSKDIQIPEDIVEEVARIYGYYKLPSHLMDGPLPAPLPDSPFEFEKRIKQLLKELKASEVYTYSLVSSQMAGTNALKLQNPLGSDFAYLRTSLMPSLVQAMTENDPRESFHLFEIANVYIPTKEGALPNEKLILAGIFNNYDFRHAKGIVEYLLNTLNLNWAFHKSNSSDFQKDKLLNIAVEGDEIGLFGVLKSGEIFYEFDLTKLNKYQKSTTQYKPLPKFPPQIEDITLVLPPKTKVASIISLIKKSDNHIKQVELKDVYSDAFTFRIWYQDPNKTLTDNEVASFRTKVILNLKQANIVVKD